MAFTISIGTFTGENELVDKDGKIVWEANGVNAQMVNTDILNPVLKVSGGRSNCNYVKIADFDDRYYFVESVESLAGGHCILRCHVDVLYTYKSSIKNLECLVARNEFQENKFLVDPLIPVEKQFIVFSKNVGGTNVVSQSSIYQYYLVKIAN